MKRSVFFFVIFSFQTMLPQSITLRDTTNQYDYIIITVPEFVTSCEAFKQHKETVRGFTTLIVDKTQIFAEFDSSNTPQDNIRNFISYAGTFWREPYPKNILIAGSIQFVPNFNIPDPIYNSPYWQSDYYYTQNIYENDSTTTDFYVGRIPCKNTTELGNYLSKVIDYENNNSLEIWMNNALFICEDDPGINFSGRAMSITEYFPPYIREYYISAADTSIYYGNKDSVYSAINDRGSSIVLFVGHFSSDSFFVSNDYFNLTDLTGLNNDSKYFFTIITSTQRAIIDSNTNLTNEMLYLSNAGSLGGIAFTGRYWWGIGGAFQRKWAQRLFNPDIKSLGEALSLDSIVSSGGLWGYMKKIVNLWADPSIKLKYDVTVNIDDLELELPTTFILEQNYPNPFNPTTKIKYQITNLSFVSLKVFDVLGKKVATLVNEEKTAGSYEVEFSTNNLQLTSGIYFYTLSAGSFIETKKMVLLK